MSKLTFGNNKATMTIIKPKIINYCSDINVLDVDWLNLNGWKKRCCALKHRNCNSRMEWHKKINNKTYTVRKYGNILFKIKWTLIGKRQPCCKLNQGIYWNVIYLDNFGDVVKLIKEL